MLHFIYHHLQHFWLVREHVTTNHNINNNAVVWICCTINQLMFVTTIVRKLSQTLLRKKQMFVNFTHAS